MTKYIRSTRKLSTLIKEIFAASEISLDTKAIVLLLAGTMPSEKFTLWIDQIPALNVLSDKYKAVSFLRAELEDVCSKYILLNILKTIDCDLNSDELQRFISESMVVAEAEPVQQAWFANNTDKFFTCLYNASVNRVTSHTLR